jgi:hypothetical protein
MKLLNARKVSMGAPQLPVPTYQEYLADFQGKDVNRETGVETGNQAIIDEIPSMVQSGIEDARDPEVWSPLNLDGTMVQSGQPHPRLRRSKVQELIREHQRKFKEEHPISEGFNKVNNALLKTANFVSESGILDKIPGGSVLNNIFQFAKENAGVTDTLDGMGKKKRQILRRNSKKRV